MAVAAKLTEARAAVVNEEVCITLDKPTPDAEEIVKPGLLFIVKRTSTKGTITNWRLDTTCLTELTKESQSDIK